MKKTALFEFRSNSSPNNLLNPLFYKRIVQLLVNKILSIFGTGNVIIPVHNSTAMVDFDLMITNLMKKTNDQLDTERVVGEDEKTQARIKARQMIRTMSADTSFVSGVQVLSPLDTLGIILTMARREKNLSIGELADIVDLDQDTLFRIENGFASMEEVADNLEVICDAVGLYYEKLSNFIAKLTVEANT